MLGCHLCKITGIQAWHLPQDLPSGAGGAGLVTNQHRGVAGQVKAHVTVGHANLQQMVSSLSWGYPKSWMIYGSKKQLVT